MGPSFLWPTWGPDRKVHGQCIVQILRFMGPTKGPNTKVHRANMGLSTKVHRTNLGLRYQGYWGRDTKVHRANMEPRFTGPKTKLNVQCMIHILRLMGPTWGPDAEVHGAHMGSSYPISLEPIWCPDTKVYGVQTARFMGPAWGPDTKVYGPVSSLDSQVYGANMGQISRFMGPT